MMATAEPPSSSSFLPLLESLEDSAAGESEKTDAYLTIAKYVAGSRFCRRPVDASAECGLSYSASVKITFFFFLFPLQSAQWRRRPPVSACS